MCAYSWTAACPERQSVIVRAGAASKRSEQGEASWAMPGWAPTAARQGPDGRAGLRPADHGLDEEASQDWYAHRPMAGNATTRAPYHPKELTAIYPPPFQHGPGPQLGMGYPPPSQPFPGSSTQWTGGPMNFDPGCLHPHDPPAAPRCGSVDEADSDGDIALHIAVAKEDEAVVSRITQLMVASQISLDTCNKLQQTSLHVAVITGNLAIIQHLLLSGACAALPDHHGNTPVHLAVRSSSLDALRTLLDWPSALKAVHRYNYNGFTPLHLAVFRRDVDMVSVLVAKGADFNCLDGTSGRTPLFHAVLNGQDDIVARLISLGASVNISNFAGITPLVVATDRRLKNITSLLISKGATVSSREDA